MPEAVVVDHFGWTGWLALSVTPVCLTLAGWLCGGAEGRARPECSRLQVGCAFSGVGLERMELTIDEMEG